MEKQIQILLLPLSLILNDVHIFSQRMESPIEVDVRVSIALIAIAEASYETRFAEMLFQ